MTWLSCHCFQLYNLNQYSTKQRDFTEFFCISLYFCSYCLENAPGKRYTVFIVQKHADTCRRRTSSGRDFKPELPPVEQIRRIVEAAEWAPSGMGRYNWHFSVVYNPEKTLKLARAIAEADNRGPEYNFYGAPVIINISCERDDRNALLNGAAAIENLMLAATELGLGSCWINQVRDQCDVPAVRALLTEYGTPEDHIVTCSAAIGYIAKETQPHERREGVCNIVK